VQSVRANPALPAFPPNMWQKRAVKAGPEKLNRNGLSSLSKILVFRLSLEVACDEMMNSFTLLLLILEFLIDIQL
jgi:hypothetical protein